MRILYGADVLYDPGSGVELLDVELTRSLREASALTFKMPRTHEAFGRIALESVEPQIEVWDGSRLIMQGRACSCEDVDGVGTVEYSCEGELAYLNDTSVRPYSTVPGAAPSLAPADPYGYFAWLVDNHNAKVEPAKRFRVGVNQGHMLDGNDHILRSDSTYPTTGAVIKEKLLESLGGFVRVRYEDGVRYVDFLADTDGVASQRIEFGANLLRFARTRDGSPICSAVIPLGSKPEGSDTRATIASLGDGNADASGRYVKRGDALVSVDLVAKVGYREAAVEWDDVAEPKNLLARGLAWLPAQANEVETIKIDAYDMARIDPSVEPFELGSYVRATSLPHNYDSYMIVSKIRSRPGDAGGDEYTFGLDGDDIGDIVRKHASALNAGINSAYEMSEAVDRIAKDAQERADAAQGSADKAQEDADAAKEVAGKAKAEAEKAAEDAVRAAQEALEAKREADEATSKVDIAETELRVVKEAVAGAQAAAGAAESDAADAKAKADAANRAAADAKEGSLDAIAQAARAAVTADAARAEAEGAASDAAKVRDDLSGRIKTVTDTMVADYSKKTDLTQTEARLTSEIERSAAGIVSTVAEGYARKTDLSAVELSLGTRISQNASDIELTAKSVEQADTAANSAASAAAAASKAASKAQADAAAAVSGANDAQAAAGEAARHLAEAEKNLDEVSIRVGATEDDVKAAEAAVEKAKAAADAASASATTAKTNAAAAQATADAAKTAASTAQKAADALGVRMTAAETSIMQNSEAITLRATKGEVATAKSDAAADAKAKADAALAGAKSYSDAQLKVQADKISANVAETTELGTRVSTVEQTASGLSVSLGNTDKAVAAAASAASAAKSAADTAKSTADGAKSVADGAKSTAGTANSTANAAKANAATAQAAADKAKADAAGAQSTANAARSEAANAAKTATNYMEYTSSGLDVGNKASGKWAGFRTRMTSTAFQVLDSAGAALASYGANLVELGKGAASAVISLCGGWFSISKDEGSLTSWIKGSASLKICAVKDPGGKCGDSASVKITALSDDARGVFVRNRDSTMNGHEVDIVSNAITLDGGPIYLNGSVYLGATQLSGDGSWLYAPGVAATRICTNQSNSYPVYGGRVLYSNASGTAGTVTLAETAANMKHMRIHFADNNGKGHASLDVWAPNGKQPVLEIVEGNGSSQTLLRRTKYTISGTALAPSAVKGERGYLCFSTGSIISSDMAANYVKVVAVVGYK